MTGFITLDRKATKHQAVLWKDDGGGQPSVVSRHARLEDIPGHEDIETWAFDVPTTLQAGSPTNESRYPMVDADGAPLWEGASITFELPSTHINTYAGDGTFGKANLYGGHTFKSHLAFPNWGPGGFSSSSGKDRYSAGGKFMYDGELKDYFVLKSKIGDPHEHGTRETFVRLDDDPRSVCTLLHEPASSPSP